MKEIFEKTDKTGGERYLLLDVGGTDGMIRVVGMAIPGRLIMSTESCAPVRQPSYHIPAPAYATIPHIYDRHIPMVEELINREPLPAPKFWLNPEIKDFYQFTRDDVALIDYETHEQIKNIPVAV